MAQWEDPIRAARNAALEEAAREADRRAAMLRDPLFFSLPALPGKIICGDRARTLETFAEDVRAMKDEI